MDIRLIKDSEFPLLTCISIAVISGSRVRTQTNRKVALDQDLLTQMCDSLFRHLDRHWNVVVPDCLFSGFRVPVTPTVSSVLPDHHQSAAAVLCPAGQELPLLLREGEDSECYVAPRLPPSLSAPRRVTALWTFPSLWSRWIFNLPLLPTFPLLPLVVFLVSFHLLLHWLLFLALGVFFALSRLSLLPHLTLVSFSSRAC